MKHLNGLQNDTVKLEVLECDCGFHLGLDGTYLDQVDDIVMLCPSCGRLINTSVIMPDLEKTQKPGELIWLSDAVQFPRLIEELTAVGAITADTVTALSRSMDLDEFGIQELLGRAEMSWARIKDAMAGGPSDVEQ